MSKLFGLSTPSARTKRVEARNGDQNTISIVKISELDNAPAYGDKTPPVEVNNNQTGTLTINSPWRKLDAPKIVSFSELIIEETEKNKLEQHGKSHDVVVFGQYNKFYDPFIYFSAFDSIPNPFRWIRDKRILNDIFYIISSYLTQSDNENLFNALIPETLQPYEEYDNIIEDKFAIYEDDFSPMTLHNKLLSEEFARELEDEFEEEYKKHEACVESIYDGYLLQDLHRMFGPYYLMEVEEIM